MWLIIRKPTVSIPSSRAAAMCSAPMSASVQWVATRTTVAPARWASLRLRTVPIPGSSSVATLARVTVAATASIHSRSVCAPKP